MAQQNKGAHCEGNLSAATRACSHSNEKVYKPHSVHIHPHQRFQNWRSHFAMPVQMTTHIAHVTDDLHVMSANYSQLLEHSDVMKILLQQQ